MASAASMGRRPEQVTGYIATLKAYGVKARYIEVPKATHDAGTGYLLKK